MVSKEHRLSRKDFLLTKKSGRKFSTKHFSLVVWRQSSITNRQLNRFSVVTSSKLSKKAVIRNRLRRLIYNQLSILHSPFSICLIVYPKPSVLNLSREEINADLNQFLSKILS